MRLIIFFLLLSNTITAQVDFKLHSVKSQMKDFKVFKSSIIDYSAGIYFYQDSISFNRELADLEKKLSEPMNMLDTYKAYAKCVAAIGCGHTVINAKHIYADYYLKNKSSLPFEVTFINNKLRMKQDYLSDQFIFNKYTQILSINGVSVDSLASYMYNFISADGNNTTHKQQRLNDAFMFYYYCFVAQPQTFRLELLSDYNETIVMYFPASIPPNPRIPKESDYHTELIREIDTINNRARLTLPNPLPRNNMYKLQLDTFFMYLQDYHIENLIIDLRGNTGGLSQYYLTGYLYDNKITYEERILESSKTLNRHFIKPFDSQRLSVLFTRFITLNGKRRNVKETVPHKIRYEGELYVLTDGWTFSAASNLASILKHTSNAIVVGEETGGNYKRCSTGNLYLRLPKSKLKIKINPIQYVNNVPETKNKGGVIPNYLIHPSDYWDDSKDIQLDFIYELIRNSGN
jgi:hypothetical protein